MEEDFFPPQPTHWMNAPTGVPDYAGIPDAPPVPQAQPASDIEVSAERTDRRTQPQPNVPLGPSQEEVARGQQASLPPEYLKRYQDELAFRQQNNLPRRPAFQPEEMNPQSQYLERRFTPQQEQEFAAVNRQIDIVSKDQTINDQMKQELLAKLEQRRSTITPHLLPIKKSPYPEGQGIGDAWKNPEYPGAIFTRNKNGEQQIHWDPARPEKITDASILRMAAEMRKDDLNREGGEAKDMAEYVKMAREALVAIKGGNDLPAESKDRAAEVALGEIEKARAVGDPRLPQLMADFDKKFGKTKTASRLQDSTNRVEALKTMPYNPPAPSGAAAWFGSDKANVDPRKIEDPVDRMATIALHGKWAGDPAVETAAKKLADMMRTKGLTATGYSNDDKKEVAKLQRIIDDFMKRRINDVPAAPQPATPRALGRPM